MLFEPTWEDIITLNQRMPLQNLNVSVRREESEEELAAKKQAIATYNGHATNKLNIYRGVVLDAIYKKDDATLNSLVDQFIGKSAEPLVPSFEKRPGLKKDILKYWNQKIVEGLKARADELASPKDLKSYRRSVSFTVGDNMKYGLSSVSLTGQDLDFTFNATDYLHFIATNERAIGDSEFRARLIKAGQEDFGNPRAYFANPLAICTLVYTQDPNTDEIHVPVGLRSDKVMIYPGVYHVFGGLVNVIGDGADVDLGEHLRRELKEEMGVGDRIAGDQSEVYFDGIVRQIPSGVPEVVSRMVIPLSKEELEQSWRENAEDKFEHRSIYFCPLKELPGFLATYGPSMVPSGAAALTKFLEYKSK
jgi:hypothetical protein